MIIHGEGKEVAAAFVKARAQIGATVAKDARGNYGKYATLAALTEAITEPLAGNGCVLVQEVSLDGEGATVETWIVHESGSMLQFAPLTMPLGGKRDAQAVGSAITYGRRYAIAAICGIAPEDDDGQAATDAARQSAQTRQDGRKAAQAEELFDKPRGDIQPDTLKRLNILGSELYGAEWDAKRHQLVEHATGGETKSSRELWEKEAAVLIRGMAQKRAQHAQQNGVAA